MYDPGQQSYTKAEFDTLRAELAEARKKLKPGEFTKTAKFYLEHSVEEPATFSCAALDDYLKARSFVKQACDEIDRLTTENKVLKGSLKPETKVDEFMAEWDEFLRVCRPDDSTFLRALRIIQQYRAELQAKNKEIADHFTGITKKAKQA